jgi:hypothetical protein
VGADSSEDLEEEDYNQLTEEAFENNFKSL